MMKGALGEVEGRLSINERGFVEKKVDPRAWSFYFQYGTHCIQDVSVYSTF
jgi:hypothetical protein